jgi:pantoate kinase
MTRFFSPGSITLFFEIKDQNRNLLKRGSRGVGITTSLGAVTTIEKSRSREVVLNNCKIQDSIQHTILKFLNLNAKVYTETALPVKHGFGMSASAAISTVICLNHEFKLHLSYFEAMQIAHRAEILHHTGLGDVATQSMGGFTIRLKEGALPYGIVDRIAVDSKLVMLALDGEIETKSIITDPSYKKKIIEQGKKSFTLFLHKKRIEYAFELGVKFSKSIGLLTGEMEEIIKKSEKYGNAAMSLIGKSIVAIGDTVNLQDLFERYGTVYIAEIYNSYPKIVP